MIENLRSDSRQAVAAELLADTQQSWLPPSAHDALERSTILERFAHIKDANVQVVGAASREADDVLRDYDQSVEFVHRSFGEFETDGVSGDRYDWAFIVPARGHDASEVTDFLPILDARYGVSASAMHRTVAHLAPTHIETYHSSSDARGMIVFTPAYFDSSRKNDRAYVAREMLPAARRRVDEAARLVRQRYAVGLAGLGAVLPGVTNFGKTIREPELVTTTGHGGTVHLIAELVEQVSVLRDTAAHVGILGLGSIGSSALAMLRSSYEEGVPIQSFRLYDEKPQLVQQYTRSLAGEVVVGTQSVRELLNQSDIIVAAITDTIDLDEVERRDGRPIDLSGKVIVDDSQPGCFDRNQVEARGGKLIWVVGSDQSDANFLHRAGGYHYGDKTGLYGDGASWGCEAEVGSLAITGQSERALTSSVTPETAREIGRICFESGIRAAWPPQSFGKPVEF